MNLSNLTFPYIKGRAHARPFCVSKKSTRDKKSWRGNIFCQCFFKEQSTDFSCKESTGGDCLGKTSQGFFGSSYPDDAKAGLSPMGDGCYESIPLNRYFRSGNAIASSISYGNSSFPYLPLLCKNFRFIDSLKGRAHARPFCILSKKAYVDKRLFLG